MASNLNEGTQRFDVAPWDRIDAISIDFIQSYVDPICPT